MTASVVYRPQWGAAPPFNRDHVVVCPSCGGFLDRFREKADADRFAAAHRCDDGLPPHDAVFPLQPQRRTSHRAVVKCSGAGSCAAPVHIHGCYADRGSCDSPTEHVAAAHRCDGDAG